MAGTEPGVETDSSVALSSWDAILVVRGSPGYLSEPETSRTQRSGDMPDTLLVAIYLDRLGWGMSPTLNVVISALP